MEHTSAILKYPIGIQDFASLREDGYLYIELLFKVDVNFSSDIRGVKEWKVI